MKMMASKEDIITVFVQQAKQLDSNAAHAVMMVVMRQNAVSLFPR